MGLEIRIELDETLGEQVRALAGGEGGIDRTVEQYVADLIQDDVDRRRSASETLKAELLSAFAVPESEAYPFDAEAFRQRMRDRHA